MRGWSSLYQAKLCRALLEYQRNKEANEGLELTIPGQALQSLA